MNQLFDALSGAQRDCLRLVAKGRTSKEIAKLTGFAPSTVDTYLSKAAQKLGVGSRREAALLYDRWEAQQSGKFGFSRSFPVGHVVNLPRAENSLSQEAEGASDRPKTWPKTWIASILSLPPIGGRENDLSSTGRLAAALKIAFFSALMLAATALILREGLRAFS